MAITKLLLNGVEYEMGNIYNITTEGPQLYEGRELSEYTWAQLKTKCTNADYSDLRVGDYKTITLTGGEVVKMQIAGIDTYYRTTDQNIGHHIDWISIDCLESYVQWNTTNDNNGNSTSPYPWLVSNIYNYLNNTIYPKLPSDVRAVISNKRTTLEQRYSASGKLTDSTTGGWENAGNLWVPHEYEVFGSYIYGTKGWFNGQHVQYPLFANSWRHRIKGKGNGNSRCYWWLCTAYSGSSTYCCGVTDYGRAGGSYASYTAVGVPVCFRILG